MDDKPTIIDQQDVRGGKSGTGTRYVLIGGLLLVVVAFVVIFFILRATSSH